MCFESCHVKMWIDQLTTMHVTMHNEFNYDILLVTVKAGVD